MAAQIYLAGNGDGTFRFIRLDAGDTPYSVATADFNSDGYPDLAVTNYLDGTVTVVLSGGYSWIYTIDTTSVPRAVRVADFNGDGKADLVIANNGADTIEVLLGNGDGAFVPLSAVAAGTNLWSIEVADFNGDGIADVVALSNATSNNLTVLLGNGDGTFHPLPAVTAGANPISAAVADFNGDGKADLVVADVANTVTVLLGNGDGTFRPVVQYAVDIAPASVTTGDFNGDGKIDLAVAGADGSGDGFASVLPGKGDGTFLAATDYAAGKNPSAIATEDFNGDGIADLAVVSTGDQSGAGFGVFMLLGATSAVQPPVIKAASLPSGAVGTSYSAQLTAIEGTPPYVNWTVSGGALPPGLTLIASTGAILGTPTSSAGSPFSFQVTVQDSATHPNTSAAHTFTIAITQPLVVTSATLPAGETGVPYSSPLGASGGRPPYGIWTVYSGALPAGLSLNADTGVIGGTPTSASGSPFAFGVTVSDSIGVISAAQSFSIAVAPRVSLTAASLPGGEVNAFYSASFPAAGGYPPYSKWAVSAGTLPAGLTLNAGTGVISGTPANASGSPFGFSLTVADSIGVVSAAQAFSISIAPPVVVSAPSLGTGVVGASYSATLAASGGISPYNTWVVSAGTLPPGLTLNAGTGVISGILTSTVGSPFSFSVTVKDHQGITSAAQACSLVIVPAVVVTAAALPPTAVNASYSAALAATGGIPPYGSWTVSAGTLHPA